MKMLNKLMTAVATLAIAGAVHAAPPTDFTIDFDFETDGVASASTTTGTSGFSSISSFSGGLVSGGSLSGLTPSVFSFSFDLEPGFVATITSITATTSFNGPLFALSYTTLDGMFALLGATSSYNYSTFQTLPSFSSDVAEGDTASFDIVAFDLLPGFSEFSLENFTVEGIVSAVPETSTVLLGGLGSLLVIGLGYKRRRATVAAA